MHLTEEQSERYQTTTTALLEYANQRLGVVQELPPRERELLAGQRLGLIGRELWRNLEVVEGFVRENPGGLPAGHVESVRDWSRGIPGTCIVVGYEADGNAIVEHEAGTFSVRGITREVGETMPPVPVAFRTALLPFDGCIVFGAPIDPIGRVGELAVREARERARAAGFAGTLRVADELLARSAAYGPRLVERELERLGSSHVPSPPPAGYHCGPLAGLGTDERIAACDDRIFEVLDRLAEDCDEPEDEAVLPDGLGPGGAGGWSLPAEEREVVRFAGACTTLYGLLSLPEAYDQYAAISDRPLSRRRFYDVIIDGSRNISLGHGIWSHRGVRYVVAPSLTEAAARVEVMHWLADKRLEREDDSDALRGAEVVLGLDRRSREIVDHLARQEYLQMQEYCVELLGRQGGLPRRRVERRMVERGMTRYLLDLEPVSQLVGFLAGRIPDGQDDYLFPDELAGRIIEMFIAGEAEVSDAFSLLERVGMAGCEGGAWSDTLGRMVVNVYNALPRWGMDGWSLTQITERLTGRRTFYAADGTPMRVGTDEACPCGSGRRFKSCCGR